MHEEKGALPALLWEISRCRLCEATLPHAPRPVVVAHRAARLLIVGQAPGRRVHETGIPWNDASGDLLRSWLQLSHEQFYDPGLVAVMPMGFCYPGKGASGDLPPRRECAPRWHAPLLAQLPAIRLTLLVGAYAQQGWLGEKARPGLTRTVQAFRDHLPSCFPLPHPSPRNRAWLKRHAWFETEVLPALRAAVAQALA